MIPPGELRRRAPYTRINCILCGTKPNTVVIRGFLLTSNGHSAKDDGHQPEDRDERDEAPFSCLPMIHVGSNQIFIKCWRQHGVGYR